MDPSKSRSQSPFRKVWAKAKGGLPFRSAKDSPQLEVPTTSTGPNQNAGSRSGISLGGSNVQDRPVSDLWDEAYEEIRQNKQNLVQDFETILSKDLAANIVTAGGFGGLQGKVQRSQMLKPLLDRKIKEIESDAWKLQFKDHELLVKDLIVPVVGAIQWAKDYVGSALETSPSASLAWAGVCLLLPVVLNPSTQGAAHVEALESIAATISECSVRETLYHQRYEISETVKRDATSPHFAYKAALKSLYVKILSFQMTSICYLSGHSMSRVTKDIVKWDDWTSMLAEIKKEEVKLKSLEEQWRDVKYDEECKLLRARHEDSMTRLGALAQEVSRVREVIREVQRSGDRLMFLEWLSKVDPSINYNSARSMHALSTGEWLVEKNEVFQTWKKAPSSFLWLCGKVGAGKSFLSSSVIYHLDALHGGNPYVAVAYFYFRFDEPQKQSIENLLRSLAKQLCGKRPDVPQALSSLRRFQDINHQPDFESLENVLKESISDFQDVYIVVDALDECPWMNDERSRLLNVLGRIRNWDLKNLHMFCTSRKETDIEASLKSATEHDRVAIIDLEERRQQVNQDICKYIDSEIASSEFRSWPAEVKLSVRSALTAKADGMFQYVALQLKALETAKTMDDIYQALGDLPDGLDQTYNRALMSIHPWQRNYALRCLKWLVFCFKRLELAELAEAAVIDPRKTSFDKNSRFFDVKDVLDVLAGLVVLYESPPYGSDKVTYIRLAHFSVEEFLLSDRIKQGPASAFSIDTANSHLEIAETCIYYHLQIWDRDLALKSMKDVLNLFPLEAYASQAWISHLESTPAKNQDSLRQLVESLVRHKTVALPAMISLWSGPNRWRSHFEFSSSYDLSLGGYHASENMLVEQHAIYMAYLQAIAVTTRDVKENTTATTQLSLSHPLDISPTLCAPCSYDSLLNMLSTALGCRPHESIVEYFTAHHDGDSFTYLAPRPDCNLWAYWRKHPHVVYDGSSVTWTLKHLNLIAGAVNWVHTTPLPDSPLIRLKYNAVDDSSQYRCHGEINYNNIFWYGDDLLGAKQGVVGGSLKVMDFVVRRLAIASIGMNGHSEDPFNSRYSLDNCNAPEGHRVPKSTVLTKAFDIWQLGCLYLDLVTWLLQGFAGLDEFASFRGAADLEVFGFTLDYFYDVILIEGVFGPNGKSHATASKKVVEWVDKLHRLPHCSQSIHDVLDLVMEHLLVIDPEKRMKCSLVEQRLSEIFRRAEEDHDYMLKPAPRA